MWPARVAARRRDAARALAIAPAVILMADGAGARGETPAIVAATYFGGEHDEEIRGVVVADDGGPTIAVRATRAGTSELVSSAVVRLDRAARATIWRRELPEDIQDLALGGGGALYALGQRRVFRLDLATGAVAATSEDLGATLSELSAAGDELAVIAGQTIHKLGGAALERRLGVQISRKNVSGLQLDAAGGLYVSGDTVSSTGCEPYRVPYIYHFDKSGKRDWSFYDYPAALVRVNKLNLQADTQIRVLRSDPRGRLWFIAQSDGTNTVLTQKHGHLAEPNPWIWQGCYPSACRWYQGAKLIRMVGRLSDTFDEVAAGSWWVPYARRPSPTRTTEFFEMWERRYGACGCKDDRYWRPMSSWITGVAFGSDETVLVGGGDAFDGTVPVQPPATPDAWFGTPPGANYYFAVVDADVRTVRFATALPSVRSAVTHARGDRVVIAGGVVDGKARMPATAEFPVKDAAQPRFGGGTRDGFIIVACLKPGPGCDGPLPAPAQPVKPPPARPPFDWPKLSSCMGSMGTTIVEGSLPPQASYAGAPTKPPPSGRIDEEGSPGEPRPGGDGGSGAGPGGGDGGVRGDGGGAPSGSPRADASDRDADARPLPASGDDGIGGGASAAEAGGCGCRLEGRRRPGAGAGFIATVALALLAARRRRGRALVEAALAAAGPVVLAVLAGCSALVAGPDNPPPPTSAAPSESAVVPGAPDNGGGSASPAGSGPCAPTAGGPHWLEEGETLTAKLRCSTGLALAGGAFTLGGLPRGASYDPATATLTWTPGLDQAGVYSLSVQVPSARDAGEIKIGVADRFDDPANAPLADPATYTEELGLPVMHLKTDPKLNKTTYTPATLVYRGATYVIEAKYRGNWSFTYPKKNFTLKFDKERKFSDPLVAGGFVRKRKVCLITTFDDNSYVRYRLALELWRRMDPRNIKVQHFAVALYLNGKYHGLYGVADKIDGDLLQAHGYSEDGNLYMGIDHNANFAAWRYGKTPPDETIVKRSLAEGYEKKAGLPEAGMPGAFDDIAALVDFVARSDDATFSGEIGRRIDMRDHTNWIAFATAIQAFDTLGKNSLHYRDPMKPEPWRVTLWDFNESFGQNHSAERRPQLVDPALIIYQPTGGGGYTNRNRLWRRLWDHPQLGLEIRKRYGALLRGEMSLDVVIDAFDALVKETELGARRDERLWGARFRMHWGRRETYAQEVPWLRKWIQDRWAYLLAKYP